MKNKEERLHKVLYQKYRPNSFAEVIGQEQFVNMLINAINNHRLANAYIFSGPHGIGKTTLARIFAKAINCKNSINGDACNECEACILINNSETLDIVEIDAASNNGVDNIRNIIENSNYLPSYLDYKVYIIDEAHMITTGGWNAFLKTLENPHANVIFIFATTEIQKIPKTILSRCQIYNLFSLTISELEKLLDLVIKKEKIKISKDAKLMLCELANGSARDLLSITEQLLIYNKDSIDLQTILNVFALANNQSQYDLLWNILNNKKIFALNSLKELNSKGVNIFNLANNLLDMAVDWYVYSQEKNDKLIKPSHLYLFRDKEINLNLLELFISNMQVFLPDLKKSFNQFILLSSFIIGFNNKKEIEILEEKKIETTRITKNIQTNKSIEDNKSNNSEIEKISTRNNLPYKKSSLLNSFVINDRINNSNEIHSEYKSSQKKFIDYATKRIENLDETWLKNKLPDIKDMGITQDITNQLINNNDNKSEILQNIKKDNLEKIPNISLEEYYLYANYLVDINKNKDNVVKITSLFEQIQNDKNTSYFLLRDALKFIEKIVLVNNYFIIAITSNKLKSNKFNLLTNNIELLKELSQLTNHKYYIKAYSKEELRSIAKEKKDSQIDLKQYNNYIENLNLLNKEEDAVSLTKKMLFKEE